MTRTIAQRRAADAYDKVKSLTKRDNDWQAKYTAFVKSLPATILMNGLGQAAAMLLAKAKGEREDANQVLYNQLTDWLCGQDNKIYPNDTDLVEAITKNDRYAYIRAQVEALAWLEWLKKFANAYLKQREGGN